MSTSIVIHNVVRCLPLVRDIGRYITNSQYFMITPLWLRIKFVDIVGQTVREEGVQPYLIAVLFEHHWACVCGLLRTYK
jgi:hypothetical protein